MHALRGIRADAGPFEFYALVDPAGRSGRDRGGPRRGGAGRGLGGDFGGGFDGGGITGRPTGAGATLAGGGDGGPQMLLDPDRDVSRRWVGVGSPDAVLFVISTDDVVQLVVTGEPSDASRRQISTIVRALQPDDDPR